MLSLLRQLQLQVLAFVNGEIDERGLALWLAAVGRTIDTEDRETQTLWEDASTLLTEVSTLSRS